MKERTVTIALITLFVVAGTTLGQSTSSSSTTSSQELTSIVRGPGSSESNATANPVVTTTANPIAAAIGEGGAAISNPITVVTPQQDVKLVQEFQAPETRTSPPGNPYWIPPMPVAYPKGPSVFGPMTNEYGIGAIRWTSQDRALMKKATKETGCKGIPSVIGEVVGGVLTGKWGLRARGFPFSNTLLASNGRPKNGDGRPKEIIVIYSNLNPKFVEKSLLYAGYTSGGRYSIDPPPTYKGVLIDEAMVRGICMNALYNSGVDLIMIYIEPSPVAKSESSYLGLGVASNDKNVGATFGAGKVKAESRVESRLATAVRGYVYDPYTTKMDRDVVNFVNQISLAQPGQNLPPKGAFDGVEVPLQTEEQIRQYQIQGTPPRQGKAENQVETQKAAKQIKTQKKGEVSKAAKAISTQQAAREHFRKIGLQFR